MGNGRSLGSGGSSPAGSIVSIAVVVLVVLVLVLCAGVFLLYNQEKGASNDAKIANDSYSTLNDSYNDLSGRYTALVTNNAELSERYNVLDEEFDNVSANYNALKNRSDTTSVKLADFLESDPTLAYNYKLMPDTGSENSSLLLVRVNVYNVGSSDISNANVVVTYALKTNNSSIGQFTNTTSIPSLGKRTIDFKIDNMSRFQSVSVGLS